MTNRRSFLKDACLLTSGAAMGSALLSSCSAPSTTKVDAAPVQKAFLGLQTYSLGAELAADVKGGLAKVKEMGYTALELAGYSNGKIGQTDCAEYKKMVDDSGLKLVSSHLSPPLFYVYKPDNLGKFEDFWKKAAEDHVTLGVKYMVQPSLPLVNTLDDAKNVTDIFNRAGAIAKDAGIIWGYHNHSGEFKRLATKEQIIEGEKAQAERVKHFADMVGSNATPEERNVIIATLKAMINNKEGVGVTIEEIFLKNTDPALVSFELDVYWAMMAQQDPCEWLNNYPDRYKLLHIKDRWIIGDSGLMNFENIFKTAYKNGISEFFVELEAAGNGRTQFEGVSESAKYLIAAPFVK